MTVRVAPSLTIRLQRSQPLDLRVQYVLARRPGHDSRSGDERAA
jgi:hypothetical protein